MTDELWEQVRRLRDEAAKNGDNSSAHRRRSEVKYFYGKAIAYADVCRLAGRPLPDWRPGQEDGK